jgi:NAD(P)-dependent dehydrogenase (short-subunit alcohol dehydrogenase family)
MIILMANIINEEMIKSSKIMVELPLEKKIVLITGASKRIGHAFARACAVAGADVIIHYGHSIKEAIETQEEIISLGRRAWIVPCDLNQPEHVAEFLLETKKIGPLYALINNAAIFEPLKMQETTLSEWDRHMSINLTSPFLLSQGFAEQIEKGNTGCIVNILDWRALRPGKDHFPYYISKAGLAALTTSLALILAPNIRVNGLALGAILPPLNKAENSDILKSVPAARWGDLTEVENALIFLLTGPTYITGEIIHVDGGRHLV